jgi:hypothetical protein
MPSKVNPELPAPAGPLKLYCLLNADELRQFKQKYDQKLADTIFNQFREKDSRQC